MIFIWADICRKIFLCMQVKKNDGLIDVIYYKNSDCISFMIYDVIVAVKLQSSATLEHQNDWYY